MMALKPTAEIYNRFVDLLLIVGIDDNTGLVLADNDVQHDGYNQPLENIYFQVYEAQVLAAVSATKAVTFHPCLQEDRFYPPLQATSLDGSGEHVLPSVSLETKVRSHSFTDRDKKHTVTVSAEVMKRHLSRQLEPSFTEPELPLSVEMIRSVPSFCFPDHAKVHREKPDSHVHFLVLTDDYARKTYATCITFYKPYIIQKDVETYSLEMSLDVKNRSPGVDEIKGYLPQCCVLISKFPYFYAMKECLSCMVEHIQQDLQEMFTFAKDYTYVLTKAPVPPAGNVAIRLNLFQLKIVLHPSEWPEKPVIDIPLHLVFLSFSIDDVLNIFTCILTEERIVFLSSMYGLLAVIMESFWHFIQPFKWRYTYVPIICQSHLDLLEAPGTFMMGCHARHAEIVEQISGLVVVNIDSGTVTVNKEQMTNFQQVVNKTVPEFPVEPAQLFKKVCRNFKFQTELTDVQRPSSYNPESERDYRMRTRQQFNTEISFVFLELMVNLFRGVLPELRVDHKLFNQRVFIQSLPESSKQFYIKVLKTDMFKQFIEERLAEKSDFWTDFEAKTRPYAKKVGGVLESSTKVSMRPQRRSLKKQVSVSVWPSTLMPREFQVFNLPTLNNPATYIEKNIQLLSHALEECRDLEPRASYLYLRGMFFAAKGKPQEALDDLCSLASTNARLLATEPVQQLFRAIPPEYRDGIKKRRRSLSVDLMLQIPNDDESQETKPRVKGVSFHLKMPDKDLMMEDFVKMVSGHGMADDYNTMVRLFHSLVKSQNDVYLDKATFECFYECYKDNQRHCENIKIRNGTVLDHDCILCLSQLIKTDFGTGRIGLTDKRLFFLKDVSNTFKEIIKLRNIKKLEKQQSWSMLNKIDVLVVQNAAGSFKFTSSLKQETDCWYILIEEMRSGKLVAEAIKDTSAIHQAMLNVLLLKAVIRSEEGSISSSTEKLCYFTNYMKEKRHHLPKDTKETLQNRVDPNFGEQEKKTVVALLYTPGSSCNGASDTDTRPPRLWCCLSDGKVKAFDATTWELETNMIQTNFTVCCLVAIGDKQVWAGSHEIFVIDTETMTCNKKLMEHRDLVISIQMTDDGRYAYSASIDAVIIKWEIQTLKCVQKIKLEFVENLRTFKLFDDKFWCGTWHVIVVTDLHGEWIRTFPFDYKPEDQIKLPQLSCFEITQTEVWAGYRREGRVIVWDKEEAQLRDMISFPCEGISTMMLSHKMLWIGTKGNSVGHIYIYDTDTHQKWRRLKAHDDTVRSLCCTELRYVMSGAGSKDGKIAVWSPKTLVDSDKSSEQP